MAEQESRHDGLEDPEASTSAGDAAELAALTARCHELEEMLRVILDSLPVVAWRTNRQGVFELQEGRALDRIGMQPGQLVGQNIFELYPEQTLKAFREALTGESRHEANEVYDASWENWMLPMRDPGGEVRGVIGVSLDTTEYRRTERELRAQLDLVERQRRIIQDLSTPILQVWEGVLALPMIGVIDSMRTSEVMDSLLDAVGSQRARFAILDLTGVEAVDTKTAAYLIELVRAIRLLGAEGVITGIRPSVAQTVVAIGVDLGEITTLGNLQAGLRYCITQMRRK